MFVDLNYNPNDIVWTYPGVDKVIESIRQRQGDEAADYVKNLKWKDILEHLSTGVYEFYDCNDPMFDDIKFKTHEYVPIELAKKLHYDYIRENDKNIYMSHPYGVCDNWKQIFEKIHKLKYYQESTEKFCIFLCRHRKIDQPDWGGWRWHKWGRYIGEYEPQAEYLYDEPEIDEVFTFHVARIIHV